MTYHVSTHVAQKDHNETSEETLHLMSLMHQNVMGMNPDDIFNIDQSPITFLYHSNRTLDRKRCKNIHVRSSTVDTKYTTLAAAVTESGKLLAPLLIFKGESNGRVEKKEIRNYLAEDYYACQPKAWMDEQMLHAWIEKLLIPWNEIHDPEVVPLLVLDLY